MPIAADSFEYSINTAQFSGRMTGLGMVVAQRYSIVRVLISAEWKAAGSTMPRAAKKSAVLREDSLTGLGTDSTSGR